MDLTVLKLYGFQMVGNPYLFSGDDPVLGFDCSGLVCEFLRAGGVKPYHYRKNAQGIFIDFEHNGAWQVYDIGSLAFYGKSTKEVVHVGWCLDNYSMFEAGGGDSTTTNIQVAAAKNAFVRIRPIKYRTDFLCVIRPYYPGLIK